MNKPEQIIELEKLLGFELRETKDANNINAFIPPKEYVLNDKQEIIGLSLWNCPISVHLFLSSLSNLQKLHLVEGKLVDISFLAKLPNLQLLDLNNNQIVDISPLKNLKNLKTLMLDGNQIQKFASLEELNNLQELDLSDNNITDISVIKNLPNLKILRLSNNKTLKIPLEIIEQDNCLPALRDYFQSIANPEDRQELNEAKLIFVGRGHVGKSELAEALSDDDYVFIKGRDSTEGIRIKKWALHNCLKNGQNIDFTVNIWDFAGQEINYGTHQFFLTKNSLYILVWENRLEDPTHKISLEYWLNIIALLSNDSPVLVVQNKIDEKETDVPEEQLLAQFPNIKGFFKTSCQDGRGIVELYQRIKEIIVELPHTSEIWNKNRIAVREAITSNKENYFTYSDYLKLCKKNEIDEVSAAFLAQQFHNIGIVLHYADFPRLKDTVVLKPEWVTKAAYKLIDTKLNPHKGYFKETDLETIWADEIFADKRLFLLDLMRRFDLVFNMLGTDEYIVPDLLSIATPKNLPNLPQNNKLYFEYQYDFMPHGILSRFICRNAGYLGDDFYIRENFFWRYGVYLQQNGAKAKVVMNDFGNAYINMEVSGEHSEQFLYTLRSFMQEIHKKLSNPDFKEVIPCPCETCKKEIEHKKRHYFEYKRLQKLKEKGKEYDTCDVSYEDISINLLLTGIEPIKTKDDLILEKLEAIKTDTESIKADTEQLLQLFTNEFAQIKQNISLQEEDRFALLGQLIDKQKPQNLSNYAQKAQIEFPKFNSLQNDSQNFMAMGFYFLEILPDLGDFSPAALQFCRALELEIKTVLIDFKNLGLPIIMNDSGLSTNQQAYDWLKKLMNGEEITLPQMKAIFEKMPNLLTTQLFQELDNFVNSKPLYVNLTNFVVIVTEITDKNGKDYRNKSAHTHPVSKIEAADCKDLVLQALDLWK